MEEPDVIRVSVTREKEAAADGADLYVTIRGSSLVSGKEALRKAKELSRLVEDLEGKGLSRDAVELLSVRAEQSSGPLTRSSTAQYRVRIRCREIDGLAGVLGVITAQKVASLDRLDWQYPEIEATRAGWIEEAVSHANARARAMALALGVRILGVRNAVTRFKTLDDPRSQYFGMSEVAVGVIRGRVSEAPALEVPVAHTRKIQVEVEATYRISGFEAA